MSSSLGSLDLSGAVRLGNNGAMKILQACQMCGLFNYSSNEQENDHRARGRVSLKGCGLESPLPGELVELLRVVIKDNAVDLSGNKIDNSKIFCE